MFKKSFYLLIDSPLGSLRLESTEEVLTGLYLPNHKKAPPLSSSSQKGHPLLQKTQKQLLEYFAGKRREFSIPLLLQGTEFQRVVWDQLLKIPFGKKISYKTLAKQIGNQKAVRAVGSANARNPISIIVPCHRVLASDGSLSGYAGGEEKKKWLLEHEGSFSQTNSFSFA